MSAIQKGDPTAQLVAIFPSFNAETKVYTVTQEYRGSQMAIQGMELQFQDSELSYRITHDGPVWTMQVEIPQQVIDESIDRWEIFTESTEKSLFELPEVVKAAILYDNSIAAGEATFKQAIEDAVANKSTSVFFLQIGQDVIDHLKAGVTGWQLDLIVIRRTRRMHRFLSQGFKLTLDSGLVYYTSGELGVPGDVAFILPTAPTVDPSVTIYQWGWRKRSQRIEFVGQYVEQTVELVFAPWSTLAYSPAGTNLVW